MITCKDGHLKISPAAALLLIRASFQWTKCYVIADGIGEPPSCQLHPLVELGLRFKENQELTLDEFLDELEDCVKEGQTKNKGNFRRYYEQR